MGGGAYRTVARVEQDERKNAAVQVNSNPRPRRMSLGMEDRYTRRGFNPGLSTEVRPQLFTSRGVAESPYGLFLDLAYAFAGELELLADLLQSQ